MIHYILTLIALISWPLLTAQPAWKSFSRNEMASQSINVTYSDREGNFWVGTGNGLYVFNNGAWTLINEIEDINTRETVGDVRQIWEDSAGNILIASEGKMFVYDGIGWIYYHDGNFSGYLVKYFLHDSRDDTWFCAEYSIQDQSDNIRSLPFIRGTVIRFNGLAWIDYENFAGGSNYVQHGNDIEYYTGLLEDRRGYVWMSSVTGIHIYAGSQWLRIGLETLPSEYVTGMIEAGNGDIWVSTAAGIARFDGTSWEIFRQKDGLGRNFIRQIMEDDEGRIWAFIMGNVAFQGLSCFDHGKWSHYTSGKELPAGNIISSFEDFYKSGIILTRSGAAAFNGSSWQIIGSKEGLESTRFYSLVSDSTGRSWISTDCGLFAEISNKFVKVFEPPSGTWEVTSMLLDQKSRIWIASAEGEIFLTEGTKTTRFGISDGLTGEEVKSFAEDRNGRIWAIYRKGIVLFNY